ncbi:MAG: preprotein translocase subunit Sec61beta [Thermoplasmata archaeon]|nr:MAG: preprotein translocase subunit Sec61beta [Thermoplasmata archaeon]
MAKRRKGVGFHSAAGLVRYFDAEEKTALKISPWLVVAIAIGTMIAVILANILYPLS